MKDYTKGRSPEMLEPFFPNEIFRKIIVCSFLLVIEFAAVIFFPLPFKLFNKPDHITWFLLPIYKLSKLIHNEILFILILALCALIFISWPFLTSGRIHDLLALKKVKSLNRCHDMHISERYNLWQKPISFTVVIITFISVIQLCFINL